MLDVVQKIIVDAAVDELKKVVERLPEIAAKLLKSQPLTDAERDAWAQAYDQARLEKEGI